VPEDDEVMEEAKKTVQKIIEENRKVVEQSLHVYDEYKWILYESDKLEEFLAKDNPQREEYQERINLYQQTIDKIRDEMPFELRMNMFLIECKDINDMLCERLEQLMSSILQKVTNNVFHVMAADIQSNIKQIKEELQPRAGNSKILTDMEKRGQDVKDKDQKRLKEEYIDMIEWHQMLCRNPRQRLMDSDHVRPLQLAYQIVNEIVVIIEKSEQQLKGDRKEIEDALMA
jgi:hypothetical protein